MFKRFTNACVRVVNRWLPDAFLFAVILTFLVYVAAMFATGMGPIKVLAAWGNSDGFWGLLAFSMQMALVLVLGSAMASAKPCKKVLRKAAGLCHNNMQAIVITTMVSTVCCWLFSAKAIWLNLIPLGIVLVRLIRADLIEEKELLSQKPSGH